MSESIKQVIDEHEDLALVIEALEALEKKCRMYANRPLQGYGKATEQMKKDNWETKADKLNSIACKISEQYY
jgi:hypothetical protein